MKTLTAFLINFKKLKHRTGKALFLILPIVVLVSLSTIISSQVKNVQKALDESIFGEIEEESTVLQLEYPMEEFTTGGGPGQGKSFSISGGSGMLNESQYTEVDLEKIKSIENVESAAINYDIPIPNMTTANLFADTILKFRSLSALNSDMAGIYTSEDFSYTEGEPIPIILNSSQFTREYEDWGDQTSISIDFRSMRDKIESGEDPAQSTPMKMEAVEYDKEDMIGDEFTIKFGGFDDITDYEVTRDESVTTFAKLSADEIAELVDERAEVIGTYWDYAKLAEGVSYTFKVVGVIESESNPKMYVPEEFARKLMIDYMEKQLNARNSTAIDKDDLNSTFSGLTYDGTELNSSKEFGFGMMTGSGPAGGAVVRFEGVRDQEEDAGSTSYEIPGLVIKVAEDDTSEIEGAYTDTNVFADAIKAGDTISIKISSIYDRTQVVADLNDDGFAYQDINDLEVFNSVQSNLNKISTGVFVGFVILTIAVIILTMSKFVSESTKEIGIFRAVGFTKGNILTIFLLQSFIYTSVGYLVGLGIGFAGNLLISQVVASWFDSVVASTVRESFDVVNEVDASIFTHIDLASIGILSLILLLITIVISFVPAYKASTISPVEAIKNE